MNWNQHKNLEGSHAILSASKHTWLEKTNEAIFDIYRNSFAQSIGTMLHSYAADCIRMREKLRKSDANGVRFDLMRRGIPEFAIDISNVFPTLMEYVNDAVGFQMDPEVVLYYSELCYGTTDAIHVDNKLLRIHDLKTGSTPAKMEQLLIYAALFYLEYGYKPEKMETELRIYQSGDTVVYTPEAEEVRYVMEAIRDKDVALRRMIGSMP